MDSQLVADATGRVTIPEELSIPLIEAQFVRCRHREWQGLRNRSHDWSVRLGLMSADIAHVHANGLRYTDLVAGYYVGAPTAALQVISDFSIWFFIWDDHHGAYARNHADQRWARLRDALYVVLDKPSDFARDSNPLLAGFADCVLRFGKQLSRDWNRRFAMHFHAVIDGYDQEYRERTVGYVPLVDDYLQLRCQTFGYLVWLDCLELAAGKELLPEVIAWDEYRRAGFASQEFSGWYNDLCSLPKELASGELHNLGISLIHHRGLSRSQALAEVRDLTTQRVQDFILAEEAVLCRLSREGLSTEVDAAVRHCLFNMRNWISSVYWFHHESGRYQIDEWADRALPPYICDFQYRDDTP